MRGNVSVALQYLEAWLRGSGAVAINNLMEDTATAEIARAQLWQWIRHAVRTERRGGRHPGAGRADAGGGRDGWPSDGAPEHRCRKRRSCWTPWWRPRSSPSS